MLWKLIIKVLKVFLFFCLLWGSLVVRFGDVAKGSPMQESLSSGSRVDALLRASEHDAALLRASELDINE